MGKLNLLLLLFLLFSCFIHWKQMHSTHSRPTAYLLYRLTGENIRTAKNNSPHPDRIVYLDYIRFMAAFFVVAIHALEAASDQLAAKTPGWITVQALSAIFLLCNTLFIMCSGAVILGGKEESLGVFYLKRISRVAIPLVCYYSIYILLSSQYFDNGFLEGLEAVARQMLAGPMAWAPHLWVIYVILSLYILAPFFKIMAEHLPDHMLEALAVLIFLFQGLSTYLPVFHLSSGFGLMIQTWECVFLLGYYFAHPVSLKRSKIYLCLGAVSYGFSIVCTLLYANYETILYMDGTPTMLFMAGSIFLLFRLAQEKLPKPGYLMRFVTRYSYSILLIHWAVLFFVRDQLGVNETAFGIVGATILSCIFTFFLSGLAAFLFDNTVVLCLQTLFQKLIQNPLKK